MYGISATVRGAGAGACWFKQPGAHRQTTRRNKGVNVMGIAVLLFLIALAIASGAGFTADTRDSSDWKPTADGVRMPDRF